MIKKFIFLFFIIFSLNSLSLDEKNLFYNKATFDFWKKDVLDGPKSFYYPNGKLKSTHFYINGRKSGLWNYFYENGNLEMSALFLSTSDDEIAFIKKFDKNGVILSEGKIINSVMTDVWTYFDEGGKISHKIDYSNDEISIFDENEKLLFSLKGLILEKELEKIKKEISDERIKSFEERN